MNNLNKLISLSIELEELSRNPVYYEVRIISNNETNVILKRHVDNGYDENDYSHLFEYKAINNTLEYQCSGFHVDDDDEIEDAKQFINEWANEEVSYE